MILMEIKLHELKDLTDSMRRCKKDIEQFYINYANVKFDVIYDINKEPFELLIGAINKKWACILYIKKGFLTSMSDEDFYSLCNILNLKPSKETFTSFKFIKYIVSNAPKNCSNKIVSPKHLLPFRKKYISTSDDKEKKYFCGWNNHIKDGRKARNFNKTELFFCKRVADYCRKNNISSMWSAHKKDESNISYPWD